MKVAGIIAEYNPFHEGHKYHIEETRRLTGADQIIIVMSGDFVQRGEPAIADKYLRTRMALECGADLVLEMPAVYATASAEYFATAGVGILDAISCVDVLSFGSEMADLSALEEIAKILIEEPAIFQKHLKEFLEEGKNYPRARQEALKICLPGEKYNRILESPNDILGIEYMKALKRKNSNMQPVAIRREGSGYLEKIWEKDVETYPSATSLRHIIRTQKFDPNNLALLKAGIPSCFSEFISCISEEDYVSWEDLMPVLDYVILMEAGSLEKYLGMDHDLASRIRKMYQYGASFEKILNLCHSKNYTDAALRRIFLHIVLNLKQEKYLAVGHAVPIPYARVLGFRKTAGNLLTKIRKEGRIPLIQKVTEGKNLSDTSELAQKIYDFDLRSANLYEQIASKKAGRDYRIEYIRNPIIL